MIVHLSPGDFYVSSKGELSHSIRDFSVVFFHSSKCEYCKDIFPAFMKVSESLSGCTFAFMNVDLNNMEIVKKSERTSNKLEYVPLVTMYANGTPVAYFNPDERNPSANVDLLKEFIVNTASMIRAGKNEKTEDEWSSTTKYKAAETSIGIAICGPRCDRVCYLQESEAYKN